MKIDNNHAFGANTCIGINGTAHSEASGNDCNVAKDRTNNSVTVNGSPGSIIAPSGGNNTVTNSFGPPQEPLALYQSGEIAGRVDGAAPGPQSKQIILHNVRIDSGNVDVTALFKFRMYSLRCPIQAPIFNATHVTIAISGDTICDIE